MNPGSDFHTHSDFSHAAVMHADRVLSELEQASRSEVSPSQFYAQLFHSMSLILGVKQACVVASIEKDRWQAIASTQDGLASLAEDRLSQQAMRHSSLPLPQWCERNDASVLLACALKPTDWSLGGILAELPATAGSAPFSAADANANDTSAGLAEKLDLLRAFAEIVYAFQWQHGRQQDVLSIAQARLVACSLWQSQQASDANRILVDGLRCMLDADQVLLIQRRNAGQPSILLAANDSHEAKSDAECLHALRYLDEPSSSGLPSREQLANVAHLHGAKVAIALSTESGRKPDKNTREAGDRPFLLIEWHDSDRSCRAIPFVANGVPWLLDAWDTKKTIQPKQRTFALMRFAVGLVSLVCIVLFFIAPVQLTIQAPGVLQPGTQSLVFVPADGFVESIHVQDGQRVNENDVVAVLSSPALELQNRQLDAEIALTIQRIDGLNLNLNQIRPNQEQADVMAGRMAGEIAELETKQGYLIEQRTLLSKELDRMVLRSPIEGVVLGWQVEIALENRPVKRGDMLFRIAKLDRDWQMETRVADWESGYVLDAISSLRDTDKKLVVQYTMAANPGERGQGIFSRRSQTLFSESEGQFLSMVFVPEKPIEQPRLGAAVNIAIPCGSHPRWFVWSRSLVDAAYRRFWL